MSCYKLSLNYNVSSPSRLSRNTNSFVGFNPSNNTLYLDTQSFKLDSLKADSLISSSSVSPSSNPFQQIIDLIPLSALKDARVLRIHDSGSGNNLTFVNQTVVYGGSLVAVFDAFGNKRIGFQITVYLGLPNKLHVSELWNNTFHIGVFDSSNSRLILSTIGANSSSIEHSIFDFSTLPSTLYSPRQQSSLALTVDPTNGILYVFVVFKSSPVLRLKFSPFTRLPYKDIRSSDIGRGVGSRGLYRQSVVPVLRVQQQKLRL